MDPEEIRRREQERMEKKRRKQEDRLRKLEEKRKSLQDAGHSREVVESRMETIANNECNDDGDDSDSDISVTSPAPDSRIDELEQVADMLADKRCSFSIDSLLETPKVPRGRRPNSKYPRVQASKSVNSLGLGMMPLYPITQPIGFIVEQRNNSSRSDDECSNTSSNSPEPSTDFRGGVNIEHDRHESDQEAEDLSVRASDHSDLDGAVSSSEDHGH